MSEFSEETTGSAGGQDRALPVAGSARLRKAVLGELRADRAAVAAMVVLNSAAAGAGLVAPWLLGRIVDVVSGGTDPDPVSTIDLLAAIVLATTVAQVVLSRRALGAGYRFGERSAARVRERLLDRAQDGRYGGREGKFDSTARIPPVPPDSTDPRFRQLEL